MIEPPTADVQDAVIDFLSRPASYGLRDGEVARIETHCSVVFLAADRAYKLKRSIRYASLDYTTRALRHAACQAELVLNRRTAPSLYLGVRSINRDASGMLAFDGPGQAVDHVVVMRRFAQSDLFDHMTESGRLTPHLMHALGAAVARLHLSAEVTPAFGGSDAIRRVIADNDRELALVAASLDGAAVGTLSSTARTVLGQVAPLLDQRREQGKVRRCHGDLRLANVCLYAGQPAPFDCIEFSDEIGCIDVLFDLAFLLMDLHLRGRTDLGNAVFNAYLDCAPETEGLRALPLFLAVRAATRSYALAGNARRRSDPAEAARVLALARRHIDAGSDFLAPQPPLLLLVGGDTGPARIKFAEMLAGVAPPVPGARLLRLDPSGTATWCQAARILQAGCSVLVEGDCTREPEQAAVALASRRNVRLLGFSCGVLPPHRNGLPWHTLDASRGMPAALAGATSLVTAASPQHKSGTGLPA
ncbi:MAG: phosphotransferase [Acetobacteraceae bacterium]|nr:phosphotransferase [Acetobacteraceae bacterium]